MKFLKVLAISLASVLAFIALSVGFALLMDSGAIGCWSPPETTLDEQELRDELDSINADTSATLKVAIMNETSEIAIMNSAAQGFKKIYPNVDVEIKPVTDYETQVKVDMGSGSKYDVIWISDQYVDAYAGTYVENLDLFMDITDFDTSLYYDSVIKLGQKNHNGSQIFIPRDYNKIVCYINKAMFTEYGIAVPTNNNWTWTDFLNTCQALYDAGCNEANGDYAIGLQFEWRILLSALSKSFGGVVVNPDGTINIDENCQKGIIEFKKLIDNGYATYRNSVEVIDNFIQEHTAMCFQVRPYASSFMTAIDDLAVVAFPNMDGINGQNLGGYCGAGTTGYGISKVSQNKALAWRFIEYIASEDGQEQISKSGAIVPSLKSLGTKENAVWKTGAYKNLNNDAFVHSGTKDAIYDFYDMLPNSIYVTFYDGNINGLLVDYYQLNKPLAARIEKCRNDIKSAVKKNGNLVPITQGGVN